MRLRFLEMVGARCARTVALSSAAVLGGDGAVVEVVGHEVARDYRPTAMLRDGAGAAAFSRIAASLRSTCARVDVRRAGGVGMWSRARRGDGVWYSPYAIEATRTCAGTAHTPSTRHAATASSDDKRHCKTNLGVQRSH